MYKHMHGWNNEMQHELSKKLRFGALYTIVDSGQWGDGVKWDGKTKLDEIGERPASLENKNCDYISVCMHA